MKITFLSPQVSQGGGSRVLSIYALGLRALGHEVTVISRYPQPVSLKRRLYDKSRGRSYKYDPNYNRYFDPLGADHVQVHHAGPLSPDELPDADLLVATWWRTAFDVAAMPPEKGKKVYFVQGHEIFHEAQSDLVKGTYLLPLRKIVISTWLEAIMRDVYGDANCLKVTNAVDRKQFNTPERSKNARPTVGFIYEHSPIKGVATTLEAIGRLTRKVDVVAFGTSNPKASMPLPRGARFTRWPPQGEIPGFYAACDVWLWASVNEGFGLPILEAMACRTPVVATDAGAARDLVVEGETGYVVPIGDAAALAESTDRILALSPEDWHAMSEAAHARAHQRNWQDATREFEAALKQIAAE